MAKKYSLHVLQDNEGNFFHCVFEEATQQVFGFYYFQDDAEKWFQFLNRGGAFDGFTPAYILKESNIRKNKKQLDNEFSSLVSH